MESIISKLATSEISIVELVSVFEETGLILGLLETRKTGFLVSGPILGKTGELSGRFFDLRSTDPRFKPYWRHLIVVLNKALLN